MTKPFTEYLQKNVHVNYNICVNASREFILPSGSVQDQFENQLSLRVCNCGYITAIAILHFNYLENFLSSQNSMLVRVNKLFKFANWCGNDSLPKRRHKYFMLLYVNLLTEFTEPSRHSSSSFRLEFTFKRQPSSFKIYRYEFMFLSGIYVWRLTEGRQQQV